jgi:hypothetical protein
MKQKKNLLLSNPMYYKLLKEISAKKQTLRQLQYRYHDKESIKQYAEDLYKAELVALCCERESTEWVYIILTAGKIALSEYEKYLMHKGNIDGWLIVF